MKKVALSLFMISSLVRCMERELAEQKVSDDVLQQQQQISQTMFEEAPEVFKTGILGGLIRTSSGINFLFDLRTREKYKEEGMQGLIGKSTKYIATSTLYDTSCQMVVYKSKIIRPVSSDDPFDILAQGIFSIEEYLTQRTPPENIVKALDKTRTADLYLLTQVLKTQVIEGTDIDALPTILAETHSKWPPQQLSSWVHPSSGYAEILLALAYRATHPAEIEAHRSGTERWHCKRIK